jgi:hypothetical protein
VAWQLHKIVSVKAKTDIKNGNGLELESRPEVVGVLDDLGARALVVVVELPGIDKYDCLLQIIF